MPASSSVPLALLRLANQRLVGSALPTPLHAVRSMLAIQAQDLPGAKWSIGLRVPDSLESDVDSAFACGAIVRSWPMRGTLHITAAQDLPWMLDTLAPRVIDSTKSRRETLGLDDISLRRARDIAVRHLEGGRSLSRADLLAAFDHGGVSTEGSRGYHLIFHLSLTKTLCFGPPSGKEQALVLVHEWIKQPRILDREHALAELAERYFVSHGPASLADFSGWSKLSAKDAKLGLSLSRERLAELAVSGTTYYMAQDAGDVLAKVDSLLKDSVLALPGFDEYILGYKERSAVLDPAHFATIVPGANGVFMPTIVINGQVRGTWRRTAKSKETVVEPLPFTRLSKTQLQSFCRAAERWGRFVASPVRVVSP